MASIVGAGGLPVEKKLTFEMCCRTRDWIKTNIYKTIIYYFCIKICILRKSYPPLFTSADSCLKAVRFANLSPRPFVVKVREGWLDTGRFWLGKTLGFKNRLREDPRKNLKLILNTE